MSGDAMQPAADSKLRASVAHCLLWIPGSYPTPEDAADALLRRLAHDGFVVLDAASLSDADLHTLLDMRRRGDASAGDVP